MKAFTPEFDTENVCRSFKGEKADSNKAHAGEHDYVEFNEKHRLALCEIQNGRPRQEDTIRCGLAPDDYFTYDTELRMRILKRSCHLLQEGLTQKIPQFMYNRGSTSLLAIIKQTAREIKIDLAYLGDSQAFLIILKENKDIVSCETINSFLHHPTDLMERQRIESAGGQVVKGRTQGVLAISRSFGNNRFNERSAILSREPSVLTLSRTLEENQTGILLTGCDGLLAAYFNKICVAQNDSRFITMLFRPCRKLSLADIPFVMARRAAAKGSTDNITVSVLECTPNMETIYQALYDGHGGKEVAQEARNLTATVLTHAYHEEIAVNRESATVVSTPNPEPPPTLEYVDKDEVRLPLKFPPITRHLSFLGIFNTRKRSVGYGNALEKESDEPQTKITRLHSFNV